MTPAQRKVALVTSALVGLLLVTPSTGEVKVEASRSKSGEQRGLLPTLGLLALIRLSRPLLFSGGFHSYGTFGSAGAYYRPNYGGYPIGGVGGIGAATGVAGYPGYPLGFPQYPLGGIGGIGPLGATNIRGSYPTHAVPTSATLDDLRKGQESGTTVQPGYWQYLQEAASPLLHAGQKVQSRHFS